MQRGLGMKWQQVAAMAALAMGPACADMADSRGGAELEAEDGDRGELPGAPSSSLTSYDRAAAVPGFPVGISLGGLTGEDVVLDWSGTGYDGDTVVYRSTDPSALLEISLDEPLAPGVDGIMLSGVLGWTDVGAASRTTATPHYYYRVGQVQYGEVDDQLVLSTMVMKTTTATGPGFNRFGLCMLGGPTNASDIQAMFGPSVIGVHQRIPGGTEFFNFRSWTPGGGAEDFPLDYGAGVVAQFDASADPYHSLVGVVPTSEALEVTNAPGYNWMTIPVLYDGPTDTAYWVDQVGYWGVGEWSNLTQSSTWDWNEPGYEPFEMEPCGTYDVFLPDDACTDNADCVEGEFCFFVEAAACGEVASGLCFPRPPDCEGVPESPVCGCDGQTYASLCEADLAGVGVRGAGGGGTLQTVFDFEGPSPVAQSTGSWGLFTAAPASQQNPEVPFPSQVLGTDGNRASPYPGTEAESSFATLPITLGNTLSLRSWHVDEGGSFYDRKRIVFESGGQSSVLVDCYAGINPQAFCNVDTSTRPGDLWDDVSLDTASLAGQAGTLRFEYETVDGCCSFEQGWFIDDIAIDGCGVAPTDEPPVDDPPGSAEVCEAGTDAITGDPWVVCAAGPDSAWVSHSNSGGGFYHAEQICNTLGYASVGQIGGTCGNVCGYCEGTTTCDDPGNQTFDGGGSCGSDAAGQILCYTVQWECLNPVAM